MTHIAEQVATQHNKQVELAGLQHFYVWNASYSKVIWFFFLSQFCDAAILAIIHNRR
jgi:hypothetical protein